MNTIIREAITERYSANSLSAAFFDSQTRFRSGPYYLALELREKVDDTSHQFRLRAFAIPHTYSRYHIATVSLDQSIDHRRRHAVSRQSVPAMYEQNARVQLRESIHCGKQAEPGIKGGGPANLLLIDGDELYTSFPAPFIQCGMLRFGAQFLMVTGTPNIANCPVRVICDACPSFSARHDISSWGRLAHHLLPRGAKHYPWVLPIPANGLVVKTLAATPIDYAKSVPQRLKFGSNFALRGLAGGRGGLFGAGSRAGNLDARRNMKLTTNRQISGPSSKS